MSNINNNKISFEDYLNQLENINHQLNNKNLDLEKAVELYSQGVKISKKCQDLLANAEQKIKNI